MAWTDPRTWTDGELVTAAIMNPHIRDNELAMGPHLIVRKTVDETVTSSIALQDDDSLLLNVGANETWLMHFIIRYDPGGGGFDVSFGLPASGRVTAQANSDAAGTTQLRQWDLTATDGARFNFGGSSGVFRLVVIDGMFINGATPGNYTLRWAQNVSNATGVTVKANSTLWAVKLA